MAPPDRPETFLEIVMRFTPAAVSLAVVLAVTSSASIGQKPSPIDARSLGWMQRGEAAFASGAYDQAIDAYETALVLDPRNRGAFVGLARVARAQGLPGKAIRYYDDALRLEPRDVAALQAQGMAMLAKGAVESARGNLDRIKKTCKNRCEAADKLAGAIAGSSARMVSTSELKPAIASAPVKE